MPSIGLARGAPACGVVQSAACLAGTGCCCRSARRMRIPTVVLVITLDVRVCVCVCMCVCMCARTRVLLAAGHTLLFPMHACKIPSFARWCGRDDADQETMAALHA